MLVFDERRQNWNNSILFSSSILWVTFEELDTPRQNDRGNADFYAHNYPLRFIFIDSFVHLLFR
jgi:hypothetical protein